MKCHVCKKNISDNLSQCPYCGAKFDVPKKSLSYLPDLLTPNTAFEILKENLESREKRLFSITGEKGIGKTYLLNKVFNSFEKDRFYKVVGRCTPLTQLTPGGVIWDMMLNLFNLPNYCNNSEDILDDAVKFFTKEFKFLNSNQIKDFINFLYASKDGNYEEIIINKHNTLDILNSIFENLIKSGNFVFVVDNMDFIDGFSIEFFTNLIKRESKLKNFKFIAIYNEHKPIGAFFPTDEGEKICTNLHLGAVSNLWLEKVIRTSDESGLYITKREKEVILTKSDGNFAFAQQAASYCFDCQISDKAFILPDNFNSLIKERLETLKKINPDAHKLLCTASILGDKFNLALVKEIFKYNTQQFNEIVAYLVKAKFIEKLDGIYYEFCNSLLWETIMKNAQKDSVFEDINIKAGKVLSLFNINTNATMAMIAHNLKENRMAFDIWTKTARLSAYIGDINLYVIAQKQCLALLNEFNENETLNIRYNISERLGKILTEYNPEDAMEYLPDAISNAKKSGNEAAEIDLLGYLTKSCYKTGNYFGHIECVDDVLKKLKPAQNLEKALVKASKISSLYNIGNWGEVVNMIDNDILPVLNSAISYPKLNKTISLSLIFDTKLRVLLYLAKSLSMQGNDRAFEVLAQLFELTEKHRKEDVEFVIRAKLTLAYANTMKGNYKTAQEILTNLYSIREGDFADFGYLNQELSNCVCELNFVSVINALMSHDYANLREELSASAIFAQNAGNEYYKHLFKTVLGKMLCDSLQAKNALKIYNDEITYFADKKFAFGAVITWYFIAEAMLIGEDVRGSLEVASQALEIAQNPRINNYYLTAMLKILCAKIYMVMSDYESVKMNLDSSLEIANNYSMNGLISEIYYEYGKCFAELGHGDVPNRENYLSMSAKMFDKALDIVEKFTKNSYWRDKIVAGRKILENY